MYLALCDTQRDLRVCVCVRQDIVEVMSYLEMYCPQMCVCVDHQISEVICRSAGAA